MKRSRKSGDEDELSHRQSKTQKHKRANDEAVTMTFSTKRRSPRKKSSAPVPVLSASYLHRHSGTKNDIVRRLRKILDALSDDDVEANSPDYPGLAGLASTLVEETFLKHRDKDIRLYTVLACMEIFYLYAPEPPWDEKEILSIFDQTIRQLANLAHCTSPSQANYSNYFRLLEQLAVVKIGVVLVELTRTLDSATGSAAANDDDNDNEENAIYCEDALEMLAELIKTIMQSVHIEHNSEVFSHATAAVSACLEEFDGTVPIPLLDEILACVSAGPVIHVTNPKFVEATALMAASNNKQSRKENNKIKLPPKQIQQTNQSYRVAATVIKRTEDRISTPIAGLLNGLLNGDPTILEQTNISPAEDQAQTPASLPNIQASEKAADVWTVIYELHRISPQILTTVIGTITSSLQSPHIQKRVRVTKLLGRLFYSSTSNIAVKFYPCYKDWIRRSGDISPEIRTAMIKCLVSILAQKANEKELCKDASDALIQLIKNDPVKNIRIEAIRSVCDLAHMQCSGKKNAKNSQESYNDRHSSAFVSSRLLKAVGNRVSSKDKDERKDAVTGLAKIYYKNYICEILSDVQSGGDDCNLDLILDVLHDTCKLGNNQTPIIIRKKKHRVGVFDTDVDSFSIEDKYSWIPGLVFKSACFTDSIDYEMRNRVIQIIDDVLVGSDIVNAQRNKGHHDEVKLASTTRAVAVAIIVDSIRDDEAPNKMSNSFKWMHQLMLQRAKLQNALSCYIDSRSKEKKYDNSSEDALRARAESMQRLEYVASLSSPLGGTPPVNMDKLLQKFHTCRDKHIFRILATISSPTHSAAARSRAFDELPKRTRSLGSDASVWAKCLARRCAMGNFVNVDMVEHCIRLAQECFLSSEFNDTVIFLNYIKAVLSIYPSIGSTTQGFKDLLELFDHCFKKSTSKEKNEINRCGILTVLIEIIAAAAPTFYEKHLSKSSPLPFADESEDEETILATSNLESQLMVICTRRGTPEQAKNAMHTLAVLKRNQIAKESNGDQIGNRPQKSLRKGKTDIFDTLFESLTSSSLSNTSTGLQRQRLTRTIMALSALVECSPASFISNPKGKRAIQFVMDELILDKEGSPGSLTGDNIDGRKKLDFSPDFSMDSKEGSVRSRSSPGASPKSPGYNSKVSFPCQRICKGIDFIVIYIRSTLRFIKSHAGKNNLKSKQSGHSTSADKENVQMPHFQPPSEDLILSIFTTLTRILQDSGLPPSIRDRKDCKNLSDRATLRKNAAVNLLRLCDVSLGLESKFLSHKMWHILGNIFLDEEINVREAVIEELSMMLTGQGSYRQGGDLLSSTKVSRESVGSFAPSLRFLAFVVLCVDSDHGHISMSANGNAANIGKRIHNIKNNAFQCISNLRITFEATMAQCRSMGKNAEQHFDECLKMKLMPEFSVTYALHLLAFRREIPKLGAAISGSQSEYFSQSSAGKFNLEDESALALNEARKKMLKKRLKSLLEPLVTSLGDGADNISFLLRMVEVVGSRYCPIDTSVASSLSSDLDSNSMQSPDDPFLSPEMLVEASNSEKRRDSVHHANLKVICTAAREVLLKFVKKDINLAPYPGLIQIPGSLYAKIPVSCPDSVETSTKAVQKTPAKSRQKLKKHRGADLESIEDESFRNHTPHSDPSSTSPSKNESNMMGAEESVTKLDKSEYSQSGDDDIYSSQMTYDNDHESLVKSIEKKKKSVTTKSKKTTKEKYKSNSGNSIDEDDWGEMSPIPQSRSPPLYEKATTALENKEPALPNTTKTKESHNNPPSLTRKNKDKEVKKPLSKASSKKELIDILGPKLDNELTSGGLNKSGTNNEKDVNISKKKSSAPIRISMGSKSPVSKKEKRTQKKKITRRKVSKQMKKDEMDFFDDDDLNNAIPGSSRSKRRDSQSKRTTKRKASPSRIANKKSVDRESVHSSASNTSFQSVPTRSSSRIRKKRIDV